MLKTLMKSMNSTLNEPPEYYWMQKNLIFARKKTHLTNILTNFKENSLEVLIY